MALPFPCLSYCFLLKTTLQSVDVRNTCVDNSQKFIIPIKTWIICYALKPLFFSAMALVGVSLSGTPPPPALISFPSLFSYSVISLAFSLPLVVFAVFLPCLLLF